ncbi:MAG: FprA family A-type flavoprotein [Candidatus Omnitrophota bacterium]
MRQVKLKEDIYWVGGIDWDLRNFHGYSTERGSTYNSYLIIDEKKVLVDTVKSHFFAEMAERAGKIADLSEIDYVVSSHTEMDHSGSLPEIMKLCPGATIITSPNGEKALKKHYRHSWKTKVVNTGDKVNIGKRDLQFILMPMVHWPDSMATYIEKDKLLFPNDAFGQHIASTERFDSEMEWDVIRSEAAKYYANIVMPYGAQVTKALDAVSKLDVDTIAPSHGIIWREHIGKIIELYREWSANITQKKAVIVYDTMWHSTEKIAGAVFRAFDESGIKAIPMNLASNHISDIITEILTARYICVGSSTLNNGLLPQAAAFLTYMKGLAPKNRKALAFGSYGWGGQSIDQIDEVLKSCGFETFEKIKIQWVPSGEELADIKQRVTSYI